ncbi:hypothetical protein Nepgr_027475 [Nepenthes gracilis]|uniref:Uncharacterized protein n=1 Tax=Nepenthes gracilis TaxID=150966 RepID=A0AAD3Y197_NEPGR|nr:hypothetical protein Nepgr_027475 [Nepenthes gracilis]
MQLYNPIARPFKDGHQQTIGQLREYGLRQRTIDDAKNAAICTDATIPIVGLINLLRQNPETELIFSFLGSSNFLSQKLQRLPEGP